MAIDILRPAKRCLLAALLQTLSRVVIRDSEIIYVRLLQRKAPPHTKGAAKEEDPAGAEFVTERG
jgi:hypothetical protein